MSVLTIFGILALLFIIIVLFVIWNFIDDQKMYDNVYDTSFSTQDEEND